MRHVLEVLLILIVDIFLDDKVASDLPGWEQLIVFRTFA